MEDIDWGASGGVGEWKTEESTSRGSGLRCAPSYIPVIRLRVNSSSGGGRFVVSLEKKSQIQNLGSLVGPTRITTRQVYHSWTTGFRVRCTLSCDLERTLVSLTSNPPTCPLSSTPVTLIWGRERKQKGPVSMSRTWKTSVPQESRWFPCTGFSGRMSDFFGFWELSLSLT